MGGTYVISDVHGHLKCFEAILGKINLRSDDRLYILGDVIDRGVHGIEILKRIMAMPNAEMLLGNHEFMMLNALGEPYDGIHRSLSDSTELWYENGGFRTFVSFQGQPENVRSDIVDYLKSRPLNLDVEVFHDEYYRLVHAADRKFYDLYKNKYESEAEFCVWERRALDRMRCSETNYVFGHTITCFHDNENNMKIMFKGNLIGIDCGCAAIPDGKELNTLDGRLGCIKLETNQCFYSHECERPRHLPREFLELTRKGALA